MSVEQFAQTFREEHRQVRDTLLDLIVAFQERNGEQIQTLLGQTAAYCGPHFRYEEDVLYPALVSIFGEEYIEKLLSDHDRAIGSAQQLVALGSKAELTNEDISLATRLVRGILPHVSDCDGLSLMVERLPADTVPAIFASRERAQADGLDLLTWAGGVRQRPLAATA